MSDHPEDKLSPATETLGGSIDRRPSGRYRVRLRLPDGTRRSATFQTLQLAETFRAGALDLYKGETRTTFGGFGARWLDAREVSGHHRAIATERSVWRTHVEGSDLAALPLRAVERRHVKAWLRALLAKKARVPRSRDGAVKHTERTISRSLANQALVLVRQCLAAALDEERITENPARDVKLPRRAGSTSEGFEFLSLAEVDRVLTCEDIPVAARVIYEVAIYTGLRQGELWGLHWADVALEGDRPELVVRFSHRGPTKSGKVRRVPLLVPAREAIERWKSLCPKTPEGLVFPSLRGERRPKSDDAGWGDRWEAQRGERVLVRGHRSAAGIERRVRFHDLRHTCASHLVMGSWGRAWKLDEVRSFLGHSSTKITERYAHLSPEHLHRAASETRPVGPALGPEKSVSEVPHLAKTSGAPDEDSGNPRRFRSSAFRLSIPEPFEALRAVATTLDLDRTHAAAKALLLAAASRGVVEGALIGELVSSILGTEVVAAALAAREPGPHRLMHALRLAAHVCSAVNVYTARREEGA